MTTTEEGHTVLGRPVTGDKVATYRTKTEQWEGERFLPLLDAVLNAPSVEAVRWNAYVPSFNDGDPCTWTLDGFYVKFSDGDPEAGDNEDGFLDEYDLYEWSGQARVPVAGKEEVFTAMTALDQASGHFEDFLENSFGDSVTVTATKAGFDIGYYEGGH